MRLLVWLQCVWGLKMKKFDIEQQRKAFEVVAACNFVEKFNALPCLYDDVAEKERYFQIAAEVEA